MPVDKTFARNEFSSDLAIAIGYGIASLENLNEIVAPREQTDSERIWYTKRLATMREARNSPMFWQAVDAMIEVLWPTGEAAEEDESDDSPF